MPDQVELRAAVALAAEQLEHVPGRVVAVLDDGLAVEYAMQLLGAGEVDGVIVFSGNVVGFYTRPEDEQGSIRWWIEKAIARAIEQLGVGSELIGTTRGLAS